MPNSYKAKEKVIISVAVVLEEINSILLDSKVFIHTYHINLTFANINCCHIHNLHLFVENKVQPSFHNNAITNIIMPIKLYRVANSGRQECSSCVHFALLLKGMTLAMTLICLGAS